MSTIDSGHYGDGVARRTKRLWTDEEKRSICFQTTASGVSVAQVAQRYAVNANLIFKWRRDPRYAPDPSPAPDLFEGARFLPVEIVEAVKRWCQTNANSSQISSDDSLLGCKKAAPLSENGGAGQLEAGSRGEAAFLVEVVVDRGVNGCELL